MSKYESLRAYLEGQRGERVPMTFTEIERVLGFKLPHSQQYAAWWSNNPTNNVMTKQWLAAGFRTEQVDTEGRKVIFRRTPNARLSESASSGSGDAAKKKPRRHPLFGRLKGMITIMPGTDLTEPADPDWADIAWGDKEVDEDTNGKC